MVRRARRVIVQDDTAADKARVLTEVEKKVIVDAAVASGDTESLTRFKASRIFGSLKSLQDKIKLLSRHDRFQEVLLSGTGVLELSATDYTVSADALNAAAAGTFKRTFGLAVKTAKGERITLLNGLAPTLTEAEAVADADVGAPSVTGTPALVKGALLAEITFDTDAGSTKTYAADDEVSVACDLTVAGVDLTQVTVTWTVV